jgi:heat shock protein HslJ
MRRMHVFQTSSFLVALSISIIGCLNASPSGPSESSWKEDLQQDSAPFEGEWELVSMNGQPMALERLITIRFANGEIEGFSGCNVYSGSYAYYTDGLDDSRTEVSNLVMTERACLEQDIMQLEADYLRVLQSPLNDEYQENHLILRSEDGQLEYLRRDQQNSGDSSGGDDTPASSN